jgi:predicted rRNA methylase YqxC with S4 and FtsJ domains
MERNNARYPSAGKTPELIGLIFCDASFTDFKTVLQVGLEMATSGIYFIVAIKTQFGVSKGMFEEGGEVSGPGLHCKMSEKLRAG